MFENIIFNLFEKNNEGIGMVAIVRTTYKKVFETSTHTLSQIVRTRAAETLTIGRVLLQSIANL
jgi:hypothetical protein